MVRLVFRPYTQLRRSICTSESLRTSTRVSPGFVLARHRSPSFGSQRVRSRFVRPTKSRLRTPWECARFGLKKRRDLPSQNTFFRAALLSLRLTSFDCDSTTRAHVRLLGPCFKTGRVGPDFYSPLWVCRRCRRRSTGRLTGHDRAGLLGKPGHAAENESPKANTQHREIPGPYNSTPSRSRSPTRSPTCSRRPPRIPPPSRPRKEIDSTEARRPHNGSGDTFRPSRAHPFNPLNGFTHY